jgi:hypothetical protein
MDLRDIGFGCMDWINLAIHFLDCICVIEIKMFRQK